MCVNVCVLHECVHVSKVLVVTMCVHLFVRMFWLD